MNWDKEIKIFEDWYKTSNIPVSRIQLDSCTTILNCKKMIDISLEIVKDKNGQEVYRPYLDRLLKFKEIIERSNI